MQAEYAEKSATEVSMKMLTVNLSGNDTGSDEKPEKNIFLRDYLGRHVLSVR